jgi:hypothetical protein
MEKTKNKRVRHVVPAQEVAHLWIHQIQDEAREQGGRFYFEKDVIYSYGSHFPIARVLPKKNIVLFTTQTYSPSTSKHCWTVRGAIPDTFQIVECYDPAAYNSKSNIRHFLENAYEFINEAAKPRKRAHVQARLIGNALSEMESAEKYLAIMEPRKSFPKYVKELLRYDLDYLKMKPVLLSLLDKGEKERLFTLVTAGVQNEQKARQERTKKIQDVANIIFPVYEKIRLATWIKNRAETESERKRCYSLIPKKMESLKSEISRLAVEMFSTKHGDMLRLGSPDEVITSQHARAGLKEVRALFLAYKAGKPIHGKKVGGYEVISATPDAVKIGCHLFKVAEINRFAASMKW